MQRHSNATLGGSFPVPASAAEARGRSRTSRCCSTLPERSRRPRSCSRLRVPNTTRGRSLPSALQRATTSRSRPASADCAAPSFSCPPCHWDKTTSQSHTNARYMPVQIPRTLSRTGPHPQARQSLRATFRSICRHIDFILKLAPQLGLKDFLLLATCITLQAGDITQNAKQCAV